MKLFYNKGYPCGVGNEIGLVIGTVDFEQDGKIQVDSRNTANDEPIEYYGHDLGLFSPPSVGDMVLVECHDGNPEYLFARNSVPGGVDGSKEIPSQFERDIPTNRGWVTPGDLKTSPDTSGRVGVPTTRFGGHAFEMDDGEYTVNTDGSLTASTTNKGIRITTSGGNMIHISEDTTGAAEYINLETSNGLQIKLDVDNNRIDINATSTSVNINSDNVNIGDAALEALVKGDAFKTWIDDFITAKYNAHTHLGVTVGPDVTGIPGVGLGIIPGAGVYSTKHKVE